MTRKRDRAFALTMALVFFLSTVAFSALIVWQIVKGNDQSQSETNVQNKPQEDKLQGTKLADFTPVEKVESLQIIDLQPGAGAEVPKGATITAHYTGALAKDGTIFQSSHDLGQPATFPLDGVIKGWTEGVPGMKVGGKRRLVIPYAMAYGDSGRPEGGIPAKADLVFDIELIEIK